MKYWEFAILSLLIFVIGMNYKEINGVVLFFLSALINGYALWRIDHDEM